MLTRLRLLRFAYRLRRRGHEWRYSADDGIAWSYSVFDSIPQLLAADAEVLVLPTNPPQRLAAQAVPLLFAAHCLVVALKRPGLAPAHTNFGNRTGIG